jgi:hypothetical protein
VSPPKTKTTRRVLKVIIFSNFPVGEKIFQFIQTERKRERAFLIYSKAIDRHRKKERERIRREGREGANLKK